MAVSPQPQPAFLTAILSKILSQPSSGPDAGPPAGPMAPQQSGPQPGALPQDPVAQFRDMLTKQAAQGQQTAQDAHKQGLLRGLLAGITARQPAPDPKKSQQTIADTAAPLLRLFSSLMKKAS